MIKIASRKSLRAVVDWLQIRIVEMEFEEISRNILGIPEEYFNPENGRLQHYNYDFCYRFGDIRIYGYLEGTYTDKMLVLSGSACEWFRENWLKQKKLSFKLFMKNLLIYKDMVTITRLDIAIDDFNEKPFFTPTQLTKICKKKQFVYGKSTNYLPYGDEQTGATLYLKPPTADDRLKFYDKQAELAKKQGLRKKDLPPQVRTEILFRREKAHEFFLTYIHSNKSLLVLFQSYLKEKVKFYSDQNFQVPLKKWQDFLGSVEPFKLSLPKEKISLFRKIHWLIHGGGLAVYKAVKFLEQNDVFPVELEKIAYQYVEYPPELSNELKKYVTSINREDLIEKINSDTKKIKLNRRIDKNGKNVSTERL